MSISKLNEKRKRALKPFRVDDPAMLGLVYTIEPRLNPPSPQVAITMRQDFASDWRRTHPDIEIMVFRDIDEFSRTAKVLELSSSHVERLLSRWPQ